MKKIHIDDADNQEDLELITRIQEVDLETPSDSFSDHTLSKFLAVKSQAAKAHKPLKLPLIFMLALTGFLIVPLLLHQIEGSALSASMQQFYLSMDAVSQDFQTWFLIYPMALLVVLILLTHITMRFFSYQQLRE